MINIPKIKKSNIFSNLEAINPKDEKLLRDYSLTTFEKIIIIMRKIKKILVNLKIPSDILEELDWVVNNLWNKSLFDVDISRNEADFEELSKKYADIDIKGYINMLSSYSNSKIEENFKRIRSNSSSKKIVEESKLKEKEVLPIRMKKYRQTVKLPRSCNKLTNLYEKNDDINEDEEYFNRPVSGKFGVGAYPASSLDKTFRGLKGNINSGGFQHIQDPKDDNFDLIQCKKSSQQEISTKCNSLNYPLSQPSSVNSILVRQGTLNKDKEKVVCFNLDEKNERNPSSPIESDEESYNGETCVLSKPQFEEMKKEEYSIHHSEVISSLQLSPNKQSPIHNHSSSKGKISTPTSPNKKGILHKCTITQKSSKLSLRELGYDFESMDFDILEFEKDVKHENVLPRIFTEIINQIEFIEGEKMKINKKKLENFTSSLALGYKNSNPYHNSIHAADVCQTIYSWMLNGNIQKTFEFGRNDLLAIYTAAIAHDYKHPGFNNNYLINSKDNIAITYNDKSVLENYHSAELFRIVLNQENNIFEDLSELEFRLLRKRVIEAILSTDMGMHFQSVSVIKGKVDYLEIYSGKNIEKILKETKNSVFEEQQIIINFLTHCADISHNTKTWNISKHWTTAIYEEFFLQGDLEKSRSLNISMFCDRETTSIPKAQIGFIAGIITPTFELLVRIFPTLKKTVTNIEENIEKWESKIEAQLQTSTIK